MRRVILICLLIGCGFGAGRARADSDPYSLDPVRRAMDRLSLGVSFGGDSKTLSVLGDRCAIAILKIVDEDSLRDPKTAKVISDLTRTAFKRPEYIVVASDREPRITLFLLDYLEEKVSDATVRGQIKATIEFIKAQTALPKGPTNP